MAVCTKELRFSTRGDADVIDITAGVLGVVEGAGIEEGQVLTFVRGSTATMEFEPGGSTTCARCWSG